MYLGGHRGPRAAEISPQCPQQATRTTVSRWTAGTWNTLLALAVASRASDSIKNLIKVKQKRCTAKKCAGNQGPKRGLALESYVRNIGVASKEPVACQPPRTSQGASVKASWPPRARARGQWHRPFWCPCISLRRRGGRRSRRRSSRVSWNPRAQAEAPAYCLPAAPSLTGWRRLCSAGPGAAAVTKGRATDRCGSGSRARAPGPRRRVQCAREDEKPLRGSRRPWRSPTPCPATAQSP